MAVLFTPFFQPSNVNGVPLAGALLYFYQPGSTTAITTYQNSTESTPHANPVVADASGIFPPIYVARSTFKTVLKTAAGTTVQTVDPISSPMSAPSINDTSGDHQYNFAVNELTADRTVTLPLLTGNDTLVFEAHTQTLTNKTLNSSTLTSPVIGTGLELGHATDTTLTRGAAGFMAVEGKRVPSPASQATGDVLYRGATEWERLAIGTAGQILKVNTGATAPEWVALPGAPDAVLEDQKAAGTDGGTATSGSWETRTLNTEVRDNGGLISLASNQFTPAVAGWVEWSAPAHRVQGNQSRLFNVTDTAVVAYGSSGYTDDTAGTTHRSVGGAAVVASKAYRIEHQVFNTKATDGYGDSANVGGTEVYTRVKFWRIA